MLQSPFKSVIARSAIFALVLALAISFVSLGLAPSASAQQMDEPCETDTTGKKITCSYDENGTDTVADFSAMDPEGQAIEWDLDNPKGSTDDDAGKFTIDGGMLAFKSPPNYEDPNNTDHRFVVTVRATEVLGEDDTGPAEYSEVEVTVNIENVDEDGKISFSYKRPQEGVPWKATLSDGDAEESLSWQWSVPKVLRPVLDNDQHWQDAPGEDPTSNEYTPKTTTEAVTDDPDTTDDETVAFEAGDRGKILRVKVTYNDEHGDDKVVYAKTDGTVRAVNAGREDPNKAPRFGTTANTRVVNETAKKGAHVGNPVTATEDEDLTLLTYKLVGGDATSTGTATTPAVFPDYTGPFTIDSKTGQIKVNGKLVSADEDDSAARNTASDITGSPEYAGGVWTYTVRVVARDPSGAENDGLVDETPDDTNTAEDDSQDRENAFAVTITVKEVNEKPVVRQANESSDGGNTAGTHVESAMEVATVCIQEGRDPAVKDNPRTEDVDETQLDNVVTNNYECNAMVNDILDYSFTATDDDVPGADALTVISGSAGPEANQVKLSLTGDDAARFELVELMSDADPPVGLGRFELRFKDSEANFEAPADANKDNRYEVSVMAMDEDGLTSMKALTVKIVNKAEGGKVTLSTNQPAVGFPVTATLSDPDTGETGLKWKWQSSPDGSTGSWLDIPGATSDTYTPKAAVEDDPATTLVDEEDPGDEGTYLRAIVTYRDDATAEDADDEMEMGTSANAVRVEPDLNSNPEFTGITREVAENTPEDGTVGGPVRATDPDEDVLTYSITGGADMSAFKIDSDGQIRVGKGTKLDFEGSQTTYVVEVTATDPFGGTGSTMVTITVTDVNEGPTLTAGEPCETDTTGKKITCSYDENGEDSVSDFSAMDPEGQAIEWDLDNPKGSTDDDAGKFTIDGGMLAFKSPPNYEDPNNTDHRFVVTVRATEVLGEDDTGPAEYSEVEVTVNIENVDEDGKISFSYKRPQEGVPWKATLSDGDAEESLSWQWSVPKVLRPVLDNDQHWQDAPGEDPTSNEYTPKTTTEAVTDDPDTTDDETVAFEAGDRGKILRVKVTYNDEHGDDKVVYAKTDGTVRAVNAGREDPNKAPRFGTTANTRVVNETAKKGAHVGNPVTATEDEDLTLLTYKLVGGDATSTGTATTPAVFPDYTGPFTIDSKTGQIKVNGKLVSADEDDSAARNTASDITGSPEYAGGVWTYTVRVVARDPSGAENDGLVDETPDDTNTAEDDSQDRENAFAVTITVKEVNEKPVVRQANESSDGGNTAGTHVESAMEVATVCIQEGRDPAVKDNPRTEDVDETQLDNVVTNNYECNAMVNDILDYSFTATDDDVPGADALTVISGSAGPEANQVKLSLTGDDAARFELVELMSDADPPVGLGRFELRFKDSEANFEAPADANKDNRYEVSVMAMDEDGLTSMKALTVKIVNKAEGGKVTLSTNQPAVGFPVTATLSDPDTGETGLKWKWQSSPDGSTGSWLDIPGATSDTYTPKAAVEDDPATTLVDEEDPGDEGTYLRAIVTYRDDATAEDADDEMEMGTSANAVRVEPDLNSNPEFTGITREVAENTPEDGTVGGPVRATDPDEDVLTYSITGGADMSAFKIDSDGQIRVGKGTKLDFEGSQTTYVVEVTATDPFGGTGSTMVTITVTDVNEGPTLTLQPGGTTPPAEGVVGGRANVSVREGDTAVGTYTAPAEITSPTWNLSGPDMGDFDISSSGALSFKSAPDFEAPADADTDNVYMVTVVASNGGGASASLAVTVTVTNDPSDDADSAFDPLDYDANGNGGIDRPEVIMAIRDYFDDELTRANVVTVIQAYFANPN